MNQPLAAYSEESERENFNLEMIREVGGDDWAPSRLVQGKENSLFYLYRTTPGNYFQPDALSLSLSLPVLLIHWSLKASEIHRTGTEF